MCDFIYHLLKLHQFIMNLSTFFKQSHAVIFQILFKHKLLKVSPLKDNL